MGKESEQNTCRTCKLLTAPAAAPAAKLVPNEGTPGDKMLLNFS